MRAFYYNPRTMDDSYAETNEELKNEETATSLGGRATRFTTDDTPHTVLLMLADGPSSRGGAFAYELDQAKILYKQLGALLGETE